MTPDHPTSRVVDERHRCASGSISNSESIRFLTLEMASGVVLIGALITAICWSMLAPSSYRTTWSSHFSTLAHVSVMLATPRLLVDNALMTLFFFAIAVELSNELSGGDSAERTVARRASIVALGGMLGASGLYLLCTLVSGSAGSLAGGFGIPMATDVAFPLVALSLITSKPPSRLRNFLLAVAVADDALSVVVLALVAHRHVGFAALGGAVALFACSFGGRRRIRGWLWIVIGVAMWTLLLEARVEPPLAGVLLGLMVGRSRPLGQKWRAWSTPTALVVVAPLFALANLGAVGLSAGLDRLDTRALVCVAVARLVGKPLGVLLGFALAVPRRERLEQLGVDRLGVVGFAVLCAMGVTIPMVFAQALFAGDPRVLLAIRVGLVASTLFAGIAGSILLAVSLRRQSETPTGQLTPVPPRPQ